MRLFSLLLLYEVRVCVLYSLRGRGYQIGCPFLSYTHTLLWMHWLCSVLLSAIHRTTFPAVGALLSLPLSLSSLVDAVCVRWFGGRPVKYCKLISQFLEETIKSVEEERCLYLLVLVCVYLCMVPLAVTIYTLNIGTLCEY